MAGSASFDQDYMRKMTAHHEVGREMARMAADRSVNERLRTLARMMTAEQQAEIDSLHRWWRSWFGGDMPRLPEPELAKMAGMPTPEVLRALSSLQGSAFERQFVDAMIFHHRAAIEMSRRAENEATDPRLRFASRPDHPRAGATNHAHGAVVVYEVTGMKKGRPADFWQVDCGIEQSHSTNVREKGNSMKKKEFAKFAAGVETFRAFVHGVLWLTDTNLKVFGIKATRKWNMGGYCPERSGSARAWPVRVAARRASTG